MLLTLIKSLSGGRYFIRIKVTEITDEDQARFTKFGIPVISIKLDNGKEYSVRITDAHTYSTYGFYSQEEATIYANTLRTNLQQIKTEFYKNKDDWSNEEVL